MKMGEHGWKWVKMGENGWKMGENGWKMGENEWKWLKMEKNKKLLLGNDAKWFAL